MARPAPPGRLITIPPSNDCEIARWLLTWWEVPFAEHPHVPVIHELVLTWYGQGAEKRRQRAAMKAAGKTGRPQTYPLLIGNGDKVWNVRQLLERMLSAAPTDRRPLPPGGEAELWELFEPLHDDFTAQPAIWYYTLALPHRRVTIPSFVAGVPWIENAAARIGYPLIAAVIRRVGKLTPERAAAAAEAITRTFDDVHERMADGRPYLTGPDFTLIDLVFAASAAPVVAAEGYGARPDDLPAFDSLPAGMQEQIREWRRHPTGEYVLRVYRDHRQPPR